MKINQVLNAIQILEKGGNTDFFNDENNKFISENDINNLKKLDYSDNEINIIKKYLDKYGVVIVSKKETNTNKPKMATIQYENGEIVYEDYHELDEYIANEFLEYNLDFKIKRNGAAKDKLEKNTPYPSVALSKIKNKGFNKDEIKHIINLLNENGIRVCGEITEYEKNEYDVDSLDTYINYDNNVYLEPFSENEQLNKFKEYQEETDPNKKIAIRNELVERNMRLVQFFIWKFNLVEKYDIPEAELEQIGAIALIKAVEKYDPSKSKFSTYAGVEIQYTIMNEASKMLSFLPADIRGIFPRIKNIIEEEYGKDFNGEDDMIEDITDLLANLHYIPNTDSYKEMVKKAIKIEYGNLSVEELNEDNMDNPVNNISYEAEYDKNVSNELIRRKVIDNLSNLTEREQLVLKLRFGIEENENGIKPARALSVKEVAKTFNVKEEMIRNLEFKALRKLRNPKVLDDFVENDLIVVENKKRII